MNSHYLDLDDILATGELIQCNLETNIKGLGKVPTENEKYAFIGWEIVLKSQ